MLYLNGYSVRPYDARDALLGEYRRLSKKLNSALRSARVDVTDDIPPGHRASLVRRLGEVDSRLPNLSEEHRIAMVRAARSPDAEAEARKPDVADRSEFFASQLKTTFRGFPASPEAEAEKFDFKELVEIVADQSKATFGGFLARDPQFGNEFESLIKRSSDAEIEAARVLTSALRDGFRRMSMVQSAAGRNEGLQASFEQSELVCVYLIQALLAG